MLHVTRVQLSCLVLDGHQTGSYQEDVQFTQPTGPSAPAIVEYVEEEYQKEDTSQSYPE